MRFLVAALVWTACSRVPPAEPTTVVAPIASHADAAIDAPADVAAELTCEPFDMKNPACRNDSRMCLEGLADCKCPSPPDVKNPACWAVMPCPRVPDRRVLACRAAFPCPNPPDPTNPNCPPSSVIGRVIAYQAADALITIGAGSKAGVVSTWKGTLLRGESDEALPGGEVEIVRVSSRTTVAKVHVPDELVRANPRVRLAP